MNSFYPLWDDIKASEYFPPGAESAYYVVTISKPAKRSEDIQFVRSELRDSFKYHAPAWPFAGESHLIVDLDKLGFTSEIGIDVEIDPAELPLVTREAFLPLEFLSTYAKPPLLMAIRIAELMRSKETTRKLLEYHYDSAVDRARGSSGWFVNLYKVREVLNTIYLPCERGSLGMSRNSVTKFGSLLNNHDLRHADNTNRCAEIGREDVNRLFVTAQSWVAAHLEREGLSLIT